MIPIFDNGHGGKINGEYQTNGKRSPNWASGVLYEGMFNRWVINRLIEKMDRHELPYYHASPELVDVTLGQRCDRANKIFKENPNTYFLSIHANAGGGEGMEGFTSPGTTKSDEIAEIILNDLQCNFEEYIPMRFDKCDGDKDKEAKFKVLTSTNCPSVLIECGFMDHPLDYARLWDEKFIKKLVDSLFQSITSLYK